MPTAITAAAGGSSSSSSRAVAFRARAATSNQSSKKERTSPASAASSTAAAGLGQKPKPKKKKPGPKPGPKKKRGRPAQPKKGPPPKKPRKSVAQARKERKKAVEEQKKKEKEEKKKAGGHVIYAAEKEADKSDDDDDDANSEEGGENAAFFWEVEAIVGRRVKSGKTDYLVRWKGCPESDNTWEPAANLCDTALTDALKWWREEKERIKKREEDEKRLGLLGDDDNDGAAKVIEGKGEKKAGEKGRAAGLSPMELDAPSNREPLELDSSSDEESFIDETDDDLMEERRRWKWNDAEQVPFQHVRRIDVNGPNAREIVTEARKNGTPLVLTGHRGWANFAKRWLKKRESGAVTSAGPGSGAAKVEGGKKGQEVANKANDDSAMAEKKDGATEDEVKVVTLENNENEKKDDATDGPSAEGKKKDAAPSPAEKKKVEEGDVEMVVAAQAGGIAAMEAPAAESSTVTTGDAAASKGGASRDDSSGTFDGESEEDHLDLSDPSYYLDVKAMIDDIGTEDVPVVRRNYNEANPIHGDIPAAKFLKACWPADNGAGDKKSPLAKAGKEQGEGKGRGKSKGKGKGTNKDKDGSAAAAPTNKSPPLYLHQWQFPLSDTAGRKLCHQSISLPHSILGEDLLKYWLDLPQCKFDSPLQYIFMGREETLSKLHRDCGGLAISIAPIVGQKECVMVHRSDGANCMYHLQASLDPAGMDLHAHPLLTRARVWRTVVEPGEILLMPQGTYHQCRNVTPCLSYSRFHLDTINLLPFLQSMLDGDAPELEHDEVLWNCTTDLIKFVDAVVDEAQARVKRGQAVPRLDEDTVRIVETLRSLRHIIREVARRVAIRNAVKGSARPSGATGGSSSLQSASVGESMMNKVAAEAARGDKSRREKDEKELHDWDVLVRDVDMGLHDFRHRRMEKAPDFKPRRVRAIKNALRAGTAGKGGAAGGGGKSGGRPVVAYNTELEKGYLTLKTAPTAPRGSGGSSGQVSVASLSVGDSIHVRLEGRRCPGKILQIENDLDVAYLSFEDYPSLYDEFSEYDQLRTPPGSFGGEGGAEIAHEDVRAGLAVSHRDWETREEYRAVIQYTTRETMIKVRLELGNAKPARWVRVNWVLPFQGARTEKSTAEVEGGEGVEMERGENHQGGTAVVAASAPAEASASASEPPAAQLPARKTYNDTVQEWKRRAALQNRRE